MHIGNRNINHRFLPLKQYHSHLILYHQQNPNQRYCHYQLSSGNVVLAQHWNLNPFNIKLDYNSVCVHVCGYAVCRVGQYTNILVVSPNKHEMITVSKLSSHIPIYKIS